MTKAKLHLESILQNQGPIITFVVFTLGCAGK